MDFMRPLGCKINDLGKYMKHDIEYKIKATKIENPNGDWPERDHIPVNTDPIGDIDEKDAVADFTDSIAYVLNILNPNVGSIGNLGCPAIPKELDNDNRCTHPNKYKNIVSKNLRFWSCPDCGADLGDC